MASSLSDNDLQSYKTGEADCNSVGAVNGDRHFHEVSSMTSNKAGMAARNQQLLEAELVEDQPLKEPRRQVDKAPSKSLHSEHTGRFMSWDWWLWEIAGIALSLGVTAAIVIILALYDNKPLPSWRYNITLNAMVSVLSTVAKVCPRAPWCTHGEITVCKNNLCFAFSRYSN